MSPSDAPPLSDYLDFARQTALEAGALTLRYFRKGVRAEFKGDDSPVTVADREAEQLIRERIAAAYPDHAIVGEEYGATASEGASHRWIIDPIDGTKSFVHGVPLYGVLIGLEIAGRAEVGVACFPAMDEIVSAATGFGTWWNGERAWVSEVDRLDRAVVAHADARSFGRISTTRGEAWHRLSEKSYYNAGWCDAYGYALVATGRCEVMLDPIMNLWDCAALLPLLREAGGYFGDWKGEETIDAGEALGTNAALKGEVLALLKE